MTERNSIAPTSPVETMSDYISSMDGDNIQGKSTETNEVGQVKKNKFQQVVRRHIGKDRLFHLVTTLMKSIEEEKRAHRDLILSFETARNIKIDIPKPPRSANELKPKRRRKKLDLPLLDKIKAERNASTASLSQQSNNELEESIRNDTHLQGLSTKENSEPINDIIGQLEIEADQTECVTHEDINETGNKAVEGTESASVVEEKSDICEQTSPISDPNLDENLTAENVSVNIHGIKSSSIQRSASSSEKANVIDHFRATDDNFGLDELVLDSVLENTCLGSPNERKDSKTCNGKTNVMDTDIEKGSTKNIDSLKEQQIIVEVESNSSDEESCVDVEGIADDVDTISMNVNSTSNHRNRREKSKCKPTQPRVTYQGASLTTNENRIQSSKQQTSLSTISEADGSAATFESLYTKSSDSIIDIEPNKASIDKLNKPLQHIVPLEIPNDDYRAEDNDIKYDTSVNQQQFKPERQVYESLNASQKPKVLCIDLLGVYESSKDLQRINLRRPAKSRMYAGIPPNKGSNLSHKTNFYFKRWKTKPVKALSPQSKSVKFQNHNSDSHSSDESSLPSLNKQFRNIMVAKDFKRYTNPDMILWTTLDLCHSKKESNQTDFNEINDSEKLPCLQSKMNERIRDKEENETNFTPRELKLRNVIRKESTCTESFCFIKEAKTTNVKSLLNGCLPHKGIKDSLTDRLPMHK